YTSGQPYWLHMEWHDVDAALSGTLKILRVAERLGRRVHILHVSTAEELEILPQYARFATCELLVNQLTQIAPDCYNELGPYAVMNPPIRDRRHYDACWRAISDGTVAS